MSLRIAINLLWLIVISVEELSIDDGCMLWDIKENKLIFTCRTNDFSKPLRLFNNRGKEYARCSFEQFGNLSFRCSGRHESRIVSVDVQKKEVKFIIHNIKSKDVDGTWRYVQGHRKFTNNVSKFNGIVDDTDIYLEAELYKINNTTRVSLRCSACRASRGNTVEFLINNISEVSISYDPGTGKCSDLNGECSLDICSCLSTGNKFNATFPFYPNGQTLYSCDMQFTDEETSTIFSKTANIRFNGNDFEMMSTSTTIFKQPKATNKDTGGEMISFTERKDETENENVTVTHSVVPDETPTKNTGNVTKWILITIVSTIVSVLLIGTVANFCYQRKKWKESGNGPSHVGETISLLEHSGTVLSIDAETLTEHGCQSAETMTDESYLETVQKDKKMADKIKSGATKRCHPCSMLNKLMNALYWCLDCGIDLCINCKDIHQVIIKHTIVEKEKLPINYSLSFCCPQHQQQGLDYFCIDHDKLCCLECRPIHHLKCAKIDHIDILSKACRTSQAFREYEDQLHFSSGVLTTVIILLTRNIDSIEKDCNRIENLILASKENESVEKEIHSIELTNAKNSCLKTLKNNISEAKSMEAVTDEQKRLFDFLETNGSNKLLFLLIHSSKQHLLETNSKIQNLSENIKRRSVHFIGYDEENCAAGHIIEFERKHGNFQDLHQSGTNVQNPIGPAIVSLED